jgi:hypothetical protein
VGEQLLWLSIDDFNRGSTAGSLDPTRPSFGLAWREFHGLTTSPLVATLANDDVDGLRSHLFAAGDPSFNQCLRVALAGGDILKASSDEVRHMTMLAVAAQFGAVCCAIFLLTNGARVGPAEVTAAFRGGKAELMRRFWDAFPAVSPLEVALEAVKSWNVAGLRWLLDNKIDAMSQSGLVRLFKGACSSGSYSCASSVMGFSASAELICVITVQ